MTKTILPCFLLCIWTFSICFGQSKKKVEKVKTLDSKEEYENFLEKYPDSEYTPEIKRLLELKEFQNCQAMHSKEAYEEFLGKYPRSKYKAEVEYLIAKIAFENIQDFPTQENINQFLHYYSQRSYSQEIQILRIKVELQAILAMDTDQVEQVENKKQALNTFIVDYSRSSFTQEITSILDTAKEEIEECNDLIEQNKSDRFWQVFNVLKKSPEDISLVLEEAEQFDLEHKVDGRNLFSQFVYFYGYWSPIFNQDKAMANSFNAALQTFIGRGVDMNKEMAGSWSGGKLNQKLEAGHGPIHVAASYVSVPLAKFLIGKDIDLNLQDNAGRTALHFLVSKIHWNYESDRYGLKNEQIILIKLLLDKGADKSLTDTDGKTPKDYVLEQLKSYSSRTMLGKMQEGHFKTLSEQCEKILGML